MDFNFSLLLHGALKHKYVSKPPNIWLDRHLIYLILHFCLWMCFCLTAYLSVFCFHFYIYVYLYSREGHEHSSSQILFLDITM